jgi:pimeloyl-ACP methyl ester carboxylesterase
MDHYRVLWYHRVGCVGSSHIAGPVSLAQQAAHCRALMRHLGIAWAHVVGHSSSGNIALQLALDAPEAVHSLAILEPALYAVPSAKTSRGFVGAAVQLYRAGDKAGAIDTFLRGSAGRATGRCWIKPCRAPSTNTRPTRRHSSARNCPPCNSSRSRGRTRGALLSRSWRSSGRRVRSWIASGGSARHCCSRGCPTSSPSSCPMRRTYYRWRIPVAWPRGWPPSLPVTRSRHRPERWEPGRYAAEVLSGADGPQRRLCARSWLPTCGLPLTGSVWLPRKDEGQHEADGRRSPCGAAPSGASSRSS